METVEENRLQFQNGSEVMITPDEVSTILTLHKLGRGAKSIAKELGISKNTVKKYLASDGQIEYRTPERDSIFDAYADWVKARYVQHRYNAEVVRQELAKEKGITVCLRTVVRAVMPYRALARAETEATIRFETKPGEQGQIDFGERFVMIGGVSTKVFFFVMTLGFSRRLYVRAFLDEKRDSWLLGIESAFLHFGGVTETILMDNARVLVKCHDAATRMVVFSESFLAFARYWGFIPRACAPYRARTKGKDESGVKYVKRNAIAGREFASWEELEAHLERWTREVTDVRIHGTTGEQPIVRFERERNALRPLSNRPTFIQARDLLRKVHTDLCVDVDTNSYSVPWRYIGSEVSVSVKKGLVRISYAGKEIARHVESKSRRQRIVDSRHFSWNRLARRSEVRRRRIGAASRGVRSRCGRQTMSDVDTLPLMLSRLKLTAIRDRLDSLLDEASRMDFSLREAMTFFCEAEIAKKDQRRIAMALAIAKFPAIRTLDDFDFVAQPSLDPKQIRELATSRWIANGDTVLPQGPPGVGKTHLAIALGREAIQRGYSTLFTTALNLVATLAKAQSEGRFDDRLSFFSGPKLLVIDELGYLPFEKNAANMFFQLVSHRYERGATLITTNRSVGEWGEIFGDTVVATAILDRLLHHSHVLTIRGESFRLREKRRSGLVKPPSSRVQNKGGRVKS